MAIVVGAVVVFGVEVVVSVGVQVLQWWWWWRCSVNGDGRCCNRDGIHSMNVTYVVMIWLRWW